MIFIPQIFADIFTSRGVHYVQAGPKPGARHGAPWRAHMKPVDAATKTLSSGRRGKATRLSPPFPILHPAYTSSGPDWTLPFDSLVWHKAMEVLLLFVCFLPGC